jgi:hypothetical protein
VLSTIHLRFGSALRLGAEHVRVRVMHGNLCPLFLVPLCGHSARPRASGGLPRQAKPIPGKPTERSLTWLLYGHRVAIVVPARSAGTGGEGPHSPSGLISPLVRSDQPFDYYHSLRPLLRGTGTLSRTTAAARCRTPPVTDLPDWRLTCVLNHHCMPGEGVSRDRQPRPPPPGRTGGPLSSELCRIDVGPTSQAVSHE